MYVDSLLQPLQPPEGSVCELQSHRNRSETSQPGTHPIPSTEHLTPSMISPSLSRKQFTYSQEPGGLSWEYFECNGNVYNLGWVCIYIFISVHTYIILVIYIYVYMLYIYIYTYVHTHGPVSGGIVGYPRPPTSTRGRGIHRHMYICMYIQIDRQIDTRIYYIRIHTYVCICICMCMCICICIRIIIYIYIDEI